LLIKSYTGDPRLLQKTIQAKVKQITKQANHMLSWNKPKIALIMLNKAEKMCEYLKDDTLKYLQSTSLVYNTTAFICKSIGDYERSRAFLEKALALSGKYGSAPSVTHINACAVFSLLGDHKQSLQHALKAAEQIESEVALSTNIFQGDRAQKEKEALLGHAYYNVGAQYEFLGNNKMANDYFKKAFELVKTNPYATNEIRSKLKTAIEDHKKASRVMRTSQPSPFERYSRNVGLMPRAGTARRTREQKQDPYNTISYNRPPSASGNIMDQTENESIFTLTVPRKNESPSRSQLVLNAFKPNTPIFSDESFSRSNTRNLTPPQENENPAKIPENLSGDFEQNNEDKGSIIFQEMYINEHETDDTEEQNQLKELGLLEWSDKEENADLPIEMPRKQSLTIKEAALKRKSSLQRFFMKSHTAKLPDKDFHTDIPSQFANRPVSSRPHTDKNSLNVTTNAYLQEPLKFDTDNSVRMDDPMEIKTARTCKDSEKDHSPSSRYSEKNLINTAKCRIPKLFLVRSQQNVQIEKPEDVVIMDDEMVTIKKPKELAILEEDYKNVGKECKIFVKLSDTKKHLTIECIEKENNRTVLKQDHQFDEKLRSKVKRKIKDIWKAVMMQSDGNIYFDMANLMKYVCNTKLLKQLPKIVPKVESKPDQKQDIQSPISAEVTQQNSAQIIASPSQPINTNSQILVQPISPCLTQPLPNTEPQKADQVQPNKSESPKKQKTELTFSSGFEQNILKTSKQPEVIAVQEVTPKNAKLEADMVQTPEKSQKSVTHPSVIYGDDNEGQIIDNSIHDQSNVTAKKKKDSDKKPNKKKTDNKKKNKKSKSRSESEKSEASEPDNSLLRPKSILEEEPQIVIKQPNLSLHWREQKEVKIMPKEYYERKRIQRELLKNSAKSNMQNEDNRMSVKESSTKLKPFQIRKSSVNFTKLNKGNVPNIAQYNQHEKSKKAIEILPSDQTKKLETLVNMFGSKTTPTEQKMEVPAELKDTPEAKELESAQALFSKAFGTQNKVPKLRSSENLSEGHKNDNSYVSINAEDDEKSAKKSARDSPKTPEKEFKTEVKKDASSVEDDSIHCINYDDKGFEEAPKPISKHIKLDLSQSKLRKGSCNYAELPSKTRGFDIERKSRFYARDEIKDDLDCDAVFKEFGYGNKKGINIFAAMACPMPSKSPVKKEVKKVLPIINEDTPRDTNKSVDTPKEETKKSEVKNAEVKKEEPSVSTPSKQQDIISPKADQTPKFDNQKQIIIENNSPAKTAPQTTTPNEISSQPKTDPQSTKAPSVAQTPETKIEKKEDLISEAVVKKKEDPISEAIVKKNEDQISEAVVKKNEDQISEAVVKKKEEPNAVSIPTNPEHLKPELYPANSDALPPSPIMPPTKTILASLYERVNEKINKDEEMKKSLEKRRESQAVNQDSINPADLDLPTPDSDGTHDPNNYCSIDSEGDESKITKNEEPHELPPVEVVSNQEQPPKLSVGPADFSEAAGNHLENLQKTEEKHDIVEETKKVNEQKLLTSAESIAKQSLTKEPLENQNQQNQSFGKNSISKQIPDKPLDAKPSIEQQIISQANTDPKPVEIPKVEQPKAIQSTESKIPEPVNNEEKIDPKRSVQQNTDQKPTETRSVTNQHPLSRQASLTKHSLQQLSSVKLSVTKTDQPNNQNSSIEPVKVETQQATNINDPKSEEKKSVKNPGDKPEVKEEQKSESERSSVKNQAYVRDSHGTPSLIVKNPDSSTNLPKIRASNTGLPQVLIKDSIKIIEGSPIPGEAKKEPSIINCENESAKKLSIKEIPRSPEKPLSEEAPKINEPIKESFANPKISPKDERKKYMPMSMKDKIAQSILIGQQTAFALKLQRWYRRKKARELDKMKSKKETMPFLTLCTKIKIAKDNNENIGENKESFGKKEEKQSELPSFQIQRPMRESLTDRGETYMKLKFIKNKKDKSIGVVGFDCVGKSVLKSVFTLSSDTNTQLIQDLAKHVFFIFL